MSTLSITINSIIQVSREFEAGDKKIPAKYRLSVTAKGFSVEVVSIHTKEEIMQIANLTETEWISLLKK